MGINYQPHAGERGISAILRTYEDPLFGCIESVTMAISAAPTAESTGAEAERQRGFCDLIILLISRWPGGLLYIIYTHSIFAYYIFIHTHSHIVYM